MDWFLVSSLNVILSVISLAILLISVRKMMHSLHSSAELDQKVEKATQALDQGLDRAIAALHQEHKHLCVESKRLEEKIKQATLIRSQIDKSLTHLLQTRAQMKKELANKAATAKQDISKRKTAIKPPILHNPLQAQVKMNGKSLPVFVMRKISKNAHPDIY